MVISQFEGKSSLTQFRIIKFIYKYIVYINTCCRVGGTECSTKFMGTFKWGHHYFHYLHHNLDSGQITEREHCLALQKKIGLKIYWTWPNPAEQNHFPLSLSHQEASISLISLSNRRQIDWKPHHRKLTKLITWTTALSNSMKPWAMPYSVIEDGWVMVESAEQNVVHWRKK